MGAKARPVVLNRGSTDAQRSVKHLRGQRKFCILKLSVFCLFFVWLGVRSVANLCNTHSTANIAHAKKRPNLISQ